MKKQYSLVGIDGNAFAIMGYVVNSMKECGFSKIEMDEYTQRAMSSDYNNLLCESMNMIDECNKR